ncbi:MAG: hypothetical protein OEY56_09885, partial [Cyclobacteriaceae bacterium]|nr:hypothetical protein [Cyclobacteriaceae bacterium]
MSKQSSVHLSKILKINILFSLFLVFMTGKVLAADGGAETFNPGEMINHHIKDSHVWEIWHGMSVYLPVMVYSEENGLDVFSSAR